MYRDAQKDVEICDKCQWFTSMPQLAFEKLSMPVTSWIFTQWGLNMI